MLTAIISLFENVFTGSPSGFPTPISFHAYVCLPLEAHWNFCRIIPQSHPYFLVTLHPVLVPQQHQTLKMRYRGLALHSSSAAATHLPRSAMSRC